MKGRLTLWEKLEADRLPTIHLLGQFRRRAKEIKGKAPYGTDLGRKKAVNWRRGT